MFCSIHSDWKLYIKRRMLVFVMVMILTVSRITSHMVVFCKLTDGGRIHRGFIHFSGCVEGVAVDELLLTVPVLW